MLLIRVIQLGIQSAIHHNGKFDCATSRHKKTGTLGYLSQAQHPGAKLPVIDKIDYLHFDRAETSLFLNLIVKQYEVSSIIVTSNLHFSRWPGAFADDQTLIAAHRLLVTS
ncbi:ATP-binding protein [Nitrosomonas sp.]|uniref:ATP-binding protein n=1 Tax=Nitrosomonas sp. TaxID=42353 RepID=UPI0025D23CAB|nr:ATP-binding protein [Nitrosomonas sp.]MBY0485220.1 ATP-binding protein [Nitrosomonas sp.]